MFKFLFIFNGFDKIQDTLSIFSGAVTASVDGTGLVVKLPVYIVVNELLYFVQKQVEQLPFDDLVQLCAECCCKVTALQQCTHQE